MVTKGSQGSLNRSLGFFKGPDGCSNRSLGSCISRGHKGAVRDDKLCRSILEHNAEAEITGISWFQSPDMV